MATALTFLVSDDVWLRVITDRRWLNSDGSLSEQALKKRALAPPLDSSKLWSHELSGRALSHAGDVQRNGEFFVDVVRNLQKYPNKNLLFVGVAAAKVENLRPLCGGVKSDLLFSPVMDLYNPFFDEAHSDFIVYAANEDALDEVRTNLQEVLIVILSPKCSNSDVSAAINGAIGNNSTTQTTFPLIAKHNTAS